jgi:uncharacterized protein
LIETPAAQRGDVFGVICHPHPLGGGTMTNKVVHTLARAMQKCAAPTIRFNFRGVGASAGAFDNGPGEVQDAMAVIAAGRERWPNAALWLAGFSFGSFVALQACNTARANKLITVAPPIGRWDFSAIPAPQCPWLILQGDTDELVDAKAVIEWAGKSAARPNVHLLPGVGHFFHGHLHDVDARAVEFCGRNT